MSVRPPGRLLKIYFLMVNVIKIGAKANDESIGCDARKTDSLAAIFPLD